MRQFNCFHRSISLAALVAGVLGTFGLVPAGAAPITLIREDFSDGAVGPTPPAANWVDSSGGPEVGAGTGFATARSIATTYDQDNNPATAEINIPGGLEVNANSVSTQTITVIMPATIDAAPNNFAQLTFWASVRDNNATGASVSIVDTTENLTILPATTPAFAATNTNWQFNSFSVPLLPTYAGDSVNVVFNGGGSNGANGLELTDMTFTANVPEPAAMSLFGLAGLAALGRRRRRSA